MLVVAAIASRYSFSPQESLGILRLHLALAVESSKPGPAAIHLLSELEQNTPNKNRLAERLLGEDSGPVVAYGMEMLVRHKHPHARMLLEARLRDPRFNHLLETNGDLAQALLRNLPR